MRDQTPPARWALRHLVGAGRGAAHRLCGIRATLGRGDHCQVRVNDPCVSRQHCALWTQDAAAWVHDLASTNGTWINDRRVTRARLRDGDLLAAGEQLFRVERADAFDDLLRRALRSARGDTLAFDHLLARACVVGRRFGLVLIEITGAPRDGGLDCLEQAPVIADLLLESLGRVLCPGDALGVSAGGDLAALLPEVTADAVGEVARACRDTLTRDLRRAGREGPRVGVGAIEVAPEAWRTPDHLWRQAYLAAWRASRDGAETRSL